MTSFIENSALTLLLNEQFYARPEQLQVLRTAMRDCLQQAEINQQCIECVTLAVNEAAMNIIQHGYDNNEATFQLEIYKAGQELQFRLIDSAPKVIPDAMHARDLDNIRPGGLGLHFIHELMDEVVYLETPDTQQGNILQMKKQLD